MCRLTLSRQDNCGWHPRKREREREREIESQVVDAAKAIEKESGTRAELLTIGALIIGIGFL